VNPAARRQIGTASEGLARVAEQRAANQAAAGSAGKLATGVKAAGVVVGLLFLAEDIKNVGMMVYEGEL
jgi:hypothetical protein